MKKIINGYKVIQNQRKWYQLQQYKNIWWKQSRERQTGAYLQNVINAEYEDKQGNNNALSGCTRLAATEYLKRQCANNVMCGIGGAKRNVGKK